MALFCHGIRYVFLRGVEKMAKCLLSFLPRDETRNVVWSWNDIKYIVEGLPICGSYRGCLMQPTPLRRGSPLEYNSRDYLLFLNKQSYATPPRLYSSSKILTLSTSRTLFSSFTFFCSSSSSTRVLLFYFLFAPANANERKLWCIGDSAKSTRYFIRRFSKPKLARDSEGNIKGKLYRMSGACKQKRRRWNSKASTLVEAFRNCLKRHSVHVEKLSQLPTTT